MNRIAIIGASYLQLPLVKKASEMGLETHCFAWEDGAICKDFADVFYPISITEKESILDVCRRVNVDAVVTIASDLAVLTVNYVAEHLGLISNPMQFSEITTNKYQMRKCFMEHQIPSPRFSVTHGLIPEDIELFRFPVIVKPTDRSGSRGVEKVNSEKDLKNAIIRACESSFLKEAIVEEFVDGREISVESISFEGTHHVLQVTDKITTGAPFFVELEHHQPSSLPKIVLDRVKMIVLNALDALHIRYGASHAELKINDEGDIRVIEIGARMGGDFIGSDLVKLSTGYDFLKGVIDVSLGDFREPEFGLHKCSGVFFLSEETRRLKSVIENWRQYPEIVEAKITDPVLRRIQCSGDRSGYLIYQADRRIQIL